MNSRELTVSDVLRKATNEEIEAANVAMIKETKRVVGSPRMMGSLVRRVVQRERSPYAQWLKDRRK